MEPAGGGIVKLPDWLSETEMVGVRATAVDVPALAQYFNVADDQEREKRVAHAVAILVTLPSPVLIGVPHRMFRQYARKT